MIRRRMAAFLLTAAILLGDGGTLILRKQAGPLLISVFSSSEQLRVGRNDVSVMVQQSSGGVTVDNATVAVHLTQSGANGISEVFAPATHAKATNKLLFATPIDLPASGAWKLLVNVESASGSAEAAGEVTVLPAEAPLFKYWPYFAVIPVLIVLFILNQLLKRRRSAVRRPSQP